jgi:hypothetical protein
LTLTTGRGNGASGRGSSEMLQPVGSSFSTDLAGGPSESDTRSSNARSPRILASATPA